MIRYPVAAAPIEAAKCSAQHHHAAGQENPSTIDEELSPQRLGKVLELVTSELSKQNSGVFWFTWPYRSRNPEECRADKLLAI